MAYTTNSLYMTLGSDQPNISAGWTIKVRDYKDQTSLVAVVSEFNEFSFTQELNGTGTGSISIDDDNPFWGIILENGWSMRMLRNRQYIFEAWDNNIPRFAWYGQTIDETIAEEGETKTVTISGPGIAQCLTWAKIWRPGWPAKVPILGYKTTTTPTPVKIPIYRESSYNDNLSAFKWTFPVSWSTMRMWFTVFKAAQRRGLLKWVSPNFTALKDSGGKAFQVVKTVSTAAGEGYAPPELDQNLLDFLNDCTGQDFSKWFGQRLEWVMYPGFRLDVREKIGNDRSDTVRFFPGLLVSDQRTRDREAIYNRITAQDVDGNETNVSHAGSIDAWNIREQWNTTQKEITDGNLRKSIAQKFLLQQKDEKDSFTMKIPGDTVGRIPYRNFYIGDYVGVNADASHISDMTGPPKKMRVVAITVAVNSDSPVPDTEITLQSAFESKLSELEKAITRLVNNPRQVDLSQVKKVAINDSPTADSVLTYDAATNRYVATAGSAGSGGTGGGGTVYVSSTDPASSHTVQPGDFWLETYG